MNAAEVNQSQEGENRKRKRGEVREDGMVFWMYKRGNEWWITPEKYIEYKGKNAARQKKHRAKDPEKARAMSRKNHAKNKEKERAYYEANKDVLNARWREYYANNKDWLQPRKKQWGINNRAKRRPVVNAYARKKRREDPLCALKDRVRSRIKNAISKRGFGKNSSTPDMIGCSWDHLKSHFESLFKDGMSFENRHLWEVDHIIPLASAKSEEEMIRLCHYTNLQPLWTSENRRKSDKLPENFC